MAEESIIPTCAKCGSSNILIDFRFGIGVCPDCGDTWEVLDLEEIGE